MRRIFFYIAVLLFFLPFSACSVRQDEAESTVTPQPPPMPDSEPAIPNETEPALSPPPQVISAYNSYNVSLEIEPDSRTVRGIERITFTNRTDTELDSVVIRIYLNAFNRIIEGPLPYSPSLDENMIFLNGKDYGYMNILKVSVENDDAEYGLSGTVLTVNLAEVLSPGQTVQIVLQFEAYVPQIAHRAGANAHAMWCGMFLPVLSSYGSGGWRTDPYYPAGDPFILETADYTVEITTPPGYVAAGSGIKKEEVFEGNKVTTFTATMARDFAFAVSKEFKIAEVATISGVTVQFYYYTEDANVDGVLDAAKRSIEYFESAVGTYPFPNGHICIIETDMFVSGMEFSKVVFMDSKLLKLTKDYYSLTHSLGQQWFYNVVGSDQIREAWLDEAMTLYVQERFVHAAEKDFRAKMDGDYKAFAAVPGQRLRDGIGVYKSREDYYAAQCVKGKLMLYALNRLMGDEKFKQCIQQYYQAYSFKIASGADFIAAAENVYGESLRGFFDEWLNGEGLPPLEQ